METTYPVGMSRRLTVLAQGEHTAPHHAEASAFKEGVSRADAYKQVLEQMKGLMEGQRNWVSPHSPRTYQTSTNTSTGLVSTPLQPRHRQLTHHLP